MVRPNVPIFSFDAMKLLTGWQQKPRSEIDALLEQALDGEAWILEGGPSLLRQAVHKADALIWLDPPEFVRAWQVMRRPWIHRGKTRPELPAGNVDWPMQQYKFALSSLRRGSAFRKSIAHAFYQADALQKWRCRTKKHRAAALSAWADHG